MVRKNNIMPIDKKSFVISLVVLMLSAIASIINQGFEIGTGTNAFHIPSIFNFADSIEGPSDIFHQTFNRYFSGYWIVVSLFATEENLFNLFLGLQLTFRFLNLFMIWKLICLLGAPSRLASIFCGILLFFPALKYASPIGSSVYAGIYLNHSESVVAFVLLSFYLALQKKFIWSSAIVSAVFMINAFIGVWCGLVMGLTMIYFHKDETWKYIAGKASQMLGIFLLLSSPVLFWIFNSIESTVEYADYDFRQVIRLTFPYHHFIDEKLSSAIAALTAILFTNFSFKIMGKHWSREHKLLLRSIFTILTAIIIFGIFLPYITSNRFLLSLFPLRMDKYLIYLMMIVILSWCLESRQRTNKLERQFPLMILASLLNGNVVLLLISMAIFAERTLESKIKNLAVIFLLINGITHLYTGSIISFQALWGVEAVAIIFLQVGLFLVCFPKCKEYHYYAYIVLAAAALGVMPSIETGASKLAVAAIYAILIVGFTLRVQNPTLRRFFTILSNLLVVLAYSLSVTDDFGLWLFVLISLMTVPLLANLLWPHAVKLFENQYFTFSSICGVLYCMTLLLSVYSFTDRGSIATDNQGFLPFQEAQKWARENTVPHTIFLPVGETNFPTFSRRPVWVDKKLGETAFWAPEIFLEWLPRFIQLEEIDSVESARTLAIRERIEYIVFNREVVEIDTEYERCIVFENNSYWIMKTC